MKRLHLAVIIIAVLVLAGVAYTQLYSPTTSNSTPSAPSLTTSKNASLPLAAQSTGKPSCSASNKLKVVFYHDPYCPACVANEFIVNKFYEKYQGQANVSYQFVVTHSRQLAKKHGRDEVYQALDYHVCAQEQGKIQEFKECFYKKLKTDGVDYIPETAAELRECTKEVGMNEDALDACLPTARKKVDAALVDAAEFGGGTFFTPMVVIDCQYRLNSALAEQAYCALSKTC